MKLPTQWKTQLAILREPTKICKICLKPIHNVSFLSFLRKDYCLCGQCQKKLISHFRQFKIDEIKALALYDYDEEIRSLLYQLKGCYDIELAPIFLHRYAPELHLYFHDFYLVPAPSFKEENKAREFNHVEEIFKCLNLPFLELVEKFTSFKQAEHSSTGRKEIKKHLRLKKKVNLSDKKILIVDDVYTTGSTVKAMIDLIKPLHPKTIRVLVMSKTIFREAPEGLSPG